MTCLQPNICAPDDTCWVCADEPDTCPDCTDHSQCVWCADDAAYEREKGER